MRLRLGDLRRRWRGWRGRRYRRLLYSHHRCRRRLPRQFTVREGDQFFDAGHLWIEGGHCLEFLKGGFGKSKIEEQIPLVQMKLGVVGIAPNGLFFIKERIGRTVQRDQHLRSNFVAAAVVRLNAQGIVQIRKGRSQVSDPQQTIGAVEIGCVIVGIDTDGERIILNRVEHVARFFGLSPFGVGILGLRPIERIDRGRNGFR